MKQNQFCLVDEPARTFWTGHGWSPEYPDAQLFPSFTAAHRALRASPECKPAAIVQDYGLLTEIIYPPNR